MPLSPPRGAGAAGADAVGVTGLADSEGVPDAVGAAEVGVADGARAAARAGEPTDR